jgi:DNA-binding transcriptional ArsR family regulator
VATRISIPEAARLFRALGNETRLRLLLFLSDRGEAAVGDLARAVGLAQSPTSLHLKVLRLAGLVGRRREGQRHHYRLTSPLAAGLLRDVGPR